MKKIISYLLVLCMVAGIAFSNVGTREVQADDTTKTATTGTTALRPITFADFGLADGYKIATSQMTANYISSAKKAETCLIGSQFSGYIKVNNADDNITTNPFLVFGNNPSDANWQWGGVRFTFSKDYLYLNTNGICENQHMFTFTKPEGLSSYINEKFKLSFSLELANLDGGTEMNDVLIKVYVNDTLCIDNTTSTTSDSTKYGANGSYYILNTKESWFGGYIRKQYVGTTEGYCDSITVESCELPYNNTATFVDYGLADQTFSTEATNRTGTFIGSLVNTQLRGKITYNDGGRIMLNYGSTSVEEAKWTKYLGGLHLQIDPTGKFWIITGTSLTGKYPTDEEPVVISYLNEPDASGNNTQAYSDGIPTGREFEISFNTIPWDWDGDGNATDGKIEIRIDGSLLKNHYIMIKDMCSSSVSLVNRFSMLAAGNFTDGNGAITIKSETQDISRLRKVELEDFGLANGEYIKQVHNSVGPTTLLNTWMEANISVEESTSGSQIHYAVPLDKGGWYGTKFTILKDTITVANTDNSIIGGTIAASEIDRTTFFGDSFKLGLSLEKMDFHGDGQSDDARLGVWIDGKLLRNYYYVDKIDEVGTGMSVFSYLTEAEMYANTVTIADVKEEASQFTTQLGLSDVNATGAVAGVYGYGSGNPEETLMHPKTTAEKAGSLDGAIFATNIRFSKEGVKFFYGCPAESLKGWHCIRIGSDGNATETFSVGYAGGTLATLHAGVAGVKLFENTYKLSISTKYVDSDGDDLFDDLEVGVWFNDALYNNTYFYVDSLASKLNPNIAVYSEKSNGHIVLGNYTQQTPTQITHCADEFAYFVDGAKVTVDDVEKGTSWSTTKPDEYEVTYTNTTSMGTSTFKENVLVYKTNDVTADGKVTIVDLVAMMKLAAGQRNETTSRAGKEAVDYVEDANWYTAEVHNSMFETLLADENIIQAKVMSNDIVKETGSLNPDGNATYITSLGATKEGTSVISISDEESASNRTYTTDIDKFDGSGLDFVLDFDTNREIKVLQITDTQIIDSEQKRQDRELNAESIEKYKPSNMDTLLYNELDDLIAKERPDLILMTGDNVYGEFDDKGTSLDTLIAKMDGYRIPWAPIFGNHDNETAIGVSGQCAKFAASKYCIFNRRNEIGGNGNYSIGISVKGEIQRTVFMMDTNGCSNISGVTDPKDQDAITTNFVFHDEQIAWYRSTAAKVNTHVGKEIPSFLCVHVPLAEVTTALTEKGYQTKTDLTYVVEENGKNVTKTISHNYTIGNIVDKIAADGTQTWTYEKEPESKNFGFKQGITVGNNAMSEFILPHLQAAGTDGVFFGHQHVNSLSVEWNEIRFTYGLKTGRYDTSPNQTGGTVITLDGSEFDVNHSIINNSEE